MVTEIVFGKVESLSATTSATPSFNHSVEVYNPRDTPIDLSTYSIQLVEENGDRIVIQLEGIVPPKDVHVISNFTANIGIQNVSDVLDLLLSFEGKVAIELTKGNGEIIDKIGREGIETTSDVINFAELLNNPNYLDFLDINLGSIENLLIKRKGIIQKGNIDFSNEDFIKEWVVLPNFEISDLGHHLNACQTPMVYWGTTDPNQFGVDQMFPEKTLYEQEGAVNLDDASDWAEPVIRFTQTHPTDVIITIFSTFHEYVGFDDDAGFSDYDSENITFGWVMPAGQIETPGPITWAIPDQVTEGREGYGFKINAVIDGMTIPDPDNDVYDIRIEDALNGTENYEKLNSSISVFPIIAENSITIKSSDSEIFVEAVNIFTIDGVKIGTYTFDSNLGSLTEIDLRENSASGYCILYIKTSEGVVSKKFFKK